MLYRDKLRKLIGDYYSVENVLLTSSGRSAILMIVDSLPQKKVVVPAYTCEVVVEAVKLSKKQIIFAHVDKETLNISNYPEIDSDTIVIATHQYGFVSEVEQLSHLCNQKGAVLIEDCAGSLGGCINGKLTGTFGDYGVFSLSASKTLHSPTKGGFIIARDKKSLDQIRPINNILEDTVSYKLRQVLKAFGFCLAKNRLFSSWLFGVGRSSSDHSELAYLSDSSYHRSLYEWQAFVVLKQFELIEEIIKERRDLYEKYDIGISNSMIKKYPRQQEGVNIRYPILVSDRLRFINYCRKNGVSIGTGYRRLYCPDTFETEKRICEQIIYLPFGNHYSAEEIERVISVINAYQ